MTLFRCVARGTYPSAEDWSFTQWCQSALAIGDAATAWNNAVTAYWTAATAHHAPAVALAETLVYEIDPATGKALNMASTVNVRPGTGATEPLPAGVALVISKLTSQPGAKGRGRLYLPPLCAGDLSAGKVLAATVAVIVTAMEDLYSSLGGAGMTPIVWGLKSKFTYLMAGARVGNVWDSQRRRRRKEVETYTAITV